MKKYIGFVFSVVFMLLVFMPGALANNQQVKVQIAPYYTEIEHLSVYNGSAQYPLIVYKDVTYLPLTHGVCARLGLATGFDAQKGFFITSTQLPYIEADSNAFGGYDENYYGIYYDAVIPSYYIYLNGIGINSVKEEYPFLNFRGITYMPLTYKYAVEELNLDFLWSQKEQELKLYKDAGYGLIEDMTGIWWDISRGKAEGENVLLRKTSTGFTEYTDEFDQKLRYPYNWYDTYSFNTKTGFIEHLETSFSHEGEYYIPNEPGNGPITEKLSVVENALYYDGAKIYAFTNADVDGTFEAVNVYGYEYPLEDKYVILASVDFNVGSAAYYQKREYLFLKNNEGIKNLPLYDSLNRFSDIYPDGKGGAYVCTSAYLPMGVNRWITPFSSVYYLDGAGNLSDLTNAYPDINSLRAVGFYDGKLYVQAMYYREDMYGYISFSTVNSGYYVIDSNDGNKITKLYPYIEGEAFVTPDGGFYCLAKYAQKPRIVNLNTGVITIVE